MFLIVGVYILFIVFIMFIKRLISKDSNSYRCLVGKVAIVTGGNGAIGSEICLQLASRGCKVIIADVNDSNQTQEKIKYLTQNPNVISKKLDLASFESIRDFAHEINQVEGRLDILIHNAAIFGSSSLLTENGLNPVMQVNYLGPFLLTHLLIDLLKKSKPSRIIFISSLAAFFCNVNSDTFTDHKKCNTFEAAIEMYAKSKQALIIASDLFAKKLEGTGVTVNSLHPGVVLSNLCKTVEEESVFTKTWPLFAYVFGKTHQEGAKTAIYLALSEEVEYISGKFFVKCRKFWKPSQTRNTFHCQNIWEISERCCRLSSEEKIK